MIKQIALLLVFTCAPPAAQQTVAPAIGGHAGDMEVTAGAGPGWRRAGSQEARHGVRYRPMGKAPRRVAQDRP